MRSSVVRKIPWLAKALISASASSAEDWLGSNGAEHEAQVDGNDNNVVDFDLQYCNSVLHLFSSCKRGKNTEDDRGHYAH